MSASEAGRNSSDDGFGFGRVAGGGQLGQQQIALVDLLPAAEDHGPFDDVLELADVAGPEIGDQLFLRLIGEAGDLPAGLGVEFSQEVVGQQGDVLGPLAQGGDDDFQHAEAEIEVAAENALDHRLFQVAIGGGDHADIDR